MPTHVIKINNTDIDAKTGRPFSFTGELTGKPRAGINLSIYAYPPFTDTLDELFAEKLVIVDDPFAKRSYRATIELESTSYQSGVPGKQYTGKLGEIDKLDDFEFLEIEGIQYKILKYREKLDTDKTIERDALLELNRDEYLTLRTLIENHNESVNVRRIEIDTEPLILDFSGVALWSEHENDGNVFYKQLISLGVPKPSRPLDLLWTPMRWTNSTTISTRGRFEALLGDLVQAGIITEERRGDLLNKDLEDLLGESRALEIWASRARTIDAEDAWTED